MKMNEPIGNGMYAPLFVRVPIATYFMLAGYEKIHHPEQFIEQVKKFKVLPDMFSVLVGIVLPYIETVAGAFLILGAWTTLGAILLSIAIAFYIAASGVLFNGSFNPFNKDLALLGASLSLLWSGAGAWSIDRFRKSG